MLAERRRKGATTVVRDGWAALPDRRRVARPATEQRPHRRLSRPRPAGPERVAAVVPTPLAAPALGGHLGYAALKRVIDVVGAVVGLVVGGPFMALIGLSIVVESGRPVLYRARRVGQSGRAVSVLKFRTMRPDSEAILAELLLDPVIADEFNATYKLRDDPRITRLGRLLRRTSLDELPQLWNVLLGSMTLVGPRPIVEDELEKYRAVEGGAEAYLAVKPGVTGLWQVNGRNDTTYEERVLLDLEYVRNRSIRKDVEIILKTPSAALKGHGAY